MESENEMLPRKLHGFLKWSFKAWVLIFQFGGHVHNVNVTSLSYQEKLVCVLHIPPSEKHGWKEGEDMQRWGI